MGASEIIVGHNGSWILVVSIGYGRRRSSSSRRRRRRTRILFVTTSYTTRILHSSTIFLDRWCPSPLSIRPRNTWFEPRGGGGGGGDSGDNTVETLVIPFDERETIVSTSPRDPEVTTTEEEVVVVGWDVATNSENGIRKRIRRIF